MHTTHDSPVGSNGRIIFSPPLFAIAADREGDSYVIYVAGELDLSDCSRLEQAIQKAEASPANQILLDLEKLTFIDAAGLGVLVMAWHRSVGNGDRLRVSRGRNDVAHMFHLTALDTVLPFSRA